MPTGQLPLNAADERKWAVTFSEGYAEVAIFVDDRATLQGCAGRRQRRSECVCRGAIANWAISWGLITWHRRAGQDGVVFTGVTAAGYNNSQT